MQLDLLNWEPPAGGATILVFPLGKCIGKARTAAATVLRCKSVETRQAAFDRAALALARKLRTAGIGEGEVGRQLDAFARIVNLELARLANSRQQA